MDEVVSVVQTEISGVASGETFAADRQALEAASEVSLMIFRRDVNCFVRQI